MLVSAAGRVAGSYPTNALVALVDHAGTELPAVAGIDPLPPDCWGASRRAVLGVTVGTASTEPVSRKTERAVAWGTVLPCAWSLARLFPWSTAGVGACCPPGVTTGCTTSCSSTAPWLGGQAVAAMPVTGARQRKRITSPGSRPGFTVLNKRYLVMVSVLYAIRAFCLLREQGRQCAFFAGWRGQTLRQGP